MRRTTLNFLVDFVAFLFMLGMIGTGLLVRFALPPGTGGRLSIWGLGRHDWGDMHYYFAIGLVVLLLIHLVLHWSWTCVIADKLLASVGLSHRSDPGVTNRERAVRRMAIGCVTLVVVCGAIGGFYWLAVSNVKANASGTIRRGAPENRGNGSADAPSASITGVDMTDDAADEEALAAADSPRRGRQLADVRGSMTLIEVADAAGISVDALKASLGLPEHVANDEQIGHIRRNYNLSMTQIRETVAALATGRAEPS